MKAILVTQELLDKNPEFFNGVVANTIVRKQVPDKFNGEENINGGGYRNRADLQATDGWKDVVRPEYNTQTQKLGELVLDGDVYTYKKIDLPQEEINQRIINQSLSEKDQLIQEKLANDVVTQAQSDDDTTALDYQALFPMYIPIGFSYPMDYKCQDFDENNDLVLYKCVQPYNTIGVYRPKDIPAHFVKVAYPGEVPVWVQPTNSTNAYSIDDVVWYPTENSQKWISKIDANTTVPDGDEPYNRYWDVFNG